MTASNGKLTNVKSMVTGSQSFFIKTDGTVWGWGNNIYGQLGDGTQEARSASVKVIDLTDVTKVSSGENATIALKNDGTVWAWGSNNLYGAIGVETGASIDLFTSISTPIQLVGLSDIIDIQTNGISSYALEGDGTIWGWGSSFLKAGTEVKHFTPIQICNLPGVTNIGGFGSDSSPHVLRNDGTVWNAYFDGCAQL